VTIGQRESGRFWGAACGILAAAVSLGIAQLLAGLTVPQASPVLAVGQAAIDLTPEWLKTWSTATFGTDDKLVLQIGVFVVLAVLAAVTGALAVRRLAYGMWGLVVLAAVGVAAALTRPDSSLGWALPVLIGAVVGGFALTRLIRLARVAGTPPEEPAPLPPIKFDANAAASASSSSPPDTPGFPSLQEDDDELRAALSFSPADDLQAPDPPRADVPPLRPSLPAPQQSTARRSFLLASGVTLAVAAVGEFGGRELSTRRNVGAARTAVKFPRPVVPAPPLPAGVNLPVPGISPFITPNGQFYRVDTALFLPQVDPSNWQLRIHGMVDREVVVTFDDLLRRPLIEDYVTLCCVSNPVSGPYIGNAKWLGASLPSLLRQAGIQRGATQLLSTSVDGFTSGTPVQVVMDGRDSLLAVAMNGAALPVEHGFPARLVTPGLYGYVSACKWVTDIEVTTFEKAIPYWAERGWARQGPIKTESRIDVPAAGSSVKAGRTAVAGVAWAQHKGIEAVEVRVDSGPWHTATLAAVPDLDTWRQWVWQWDATPGSHTIEARATDKTGYTQTSVEAGEVPNGASGYPMNSVSVS
jgi:DMSO/TMAO reductase YedYZ molybdopterin-dependent catalytic subunit